MRSRISDQRNNHIWFPDAALFQRHKFYEADGDLFFLCEPAESLDLILVEAAQQNAIHLHRT